MAIVNVGIHIEPSDKIDRITVGDSYACVRIGEIPEDIKLFFAGSIDHIKAFVADLQSHLADADRKDGEL